MFKPLTLDIKSLVKVVILTIIGLGGNYTRIDLFYGVDFLFGSIAVLIVLSLYGFFWGTTAALIVSSITFYLWGHPYEMIIFTFEALFVGFFWDLGRKNLILFDAIFWLLLGMPAVWLFYKTVMHMDTTAVSLIMLKQSVNGIFNALLASMVILYWPLPKLMKRHKSFTRVSFRDLLFHLLAALVFFPALIIMIIDSRHEMKRAEANIVTQLEVLSADIASHLRVGYQHRLHAVNELAMLAGNSAMTESQDLQNYTEFIKRAHPDFHNMYVADVAGTTIAFYPPVNERGESTIGLNFADRPYFKALQATRSPVMSEVFMGRGGVFSPIVTLSVPVLRDNRFQGFALAAPDLKRVRDLLESYGRDTEKRITLIGSKSRVIASAISNREAMQILERRRTGTVSHLNPSVYHWRPGDENLPAMTRWKESFYVKEKIIDAVIPWKLVVEVSGAPVQKDLYSIYVRNLMAMLIFSVLVFVIAVIVSRWITQPLARLAEVTTNLPHKLLTPQRMEWPESSLAEIQSLISNFQPMAHALENNFKELKERSLELKRSNRDLKTEINERKRVEEALKESTQRLRTVIDHAPVVLWAVDKNGIFTFSEGKGLEALDLRPAEVVGHSLFELFAGNTEIISGTRRALAGDAFSTSVGVGSVALEIRYVPHKNEKGVVVGAIGEAMDVTERKQAEQERILREKLEGIIEMAGAVCHELNQPMMAIYGYSELALMNTSEDDPLFDKVVKIKKQVDRMGNITTKLMQITRYETKDYARGERIVDIEKSAQHMRGER